MRKGNFVRSVALLIVIALIVTGFAWLSDGFSNWNVKDWFKDTTARVTAQNKLSLTNPSLPDSVDSDLNIRANYDDIESAFVNAVFDIDSNTDYENYPDYYADNITEKSGNFSPWGNSSFEMRFNGSDVNSNFALLRVPVYPGHEYVFNYRALYGSLSGGQSLSDLYSDGQYESHIEIFAPKDISRVNSFNDTFNDYRYFTSARDYFIVQKYVNQDDNFIKFTVDTDIVFIKLAIWDNSSDSYLQDEYLSFDNMGLYDYSALAEQGKTKHTINYLNAHGNYITNFLYADLDESIYTRFPTLPSSPNMTFSHWVKDGNSFEGYNSEQLDLEFVDDGQEHIYTAVYDFDQVTVTFKYKNVSGVDVELPKVYNFYETISSSDYPSANLSPKYIFNGWSVDTNTNLIGDTVVTASYTIKTFTVTFKNWDGATLKTETVEYGNAATAPSNPIKIGYTFSGWDTSLDDITANRVITAQFTINTYTVVFKNWDGSVLKTENVTYGSNAVAPDNPTRTGWTFKGWDNEYINVSSDLTITAQFGINVYTVIFKNWDGSTLASEWVTYGSGTRAPVVPLRTGYKFIGWDKEFKCVTESMTITAQFRINSYTVTFKNWDGNILKTDTIEHGSSAIAPSNPIRVGYTFSGWDTALTNITADKIITAQFNKNSYTVTFYYLNEKGETVNKSVIADYGTLLVGILPDIPEIPGKVFTGWSVDSSTQVLSDMKIAVSYNNEFIEIPQDKNNISLYVAIGLGVLVLVFFVLLFSGNKNYSYSKKRRR